MTNIGPPDPSVHPVLAMRLGGFEPPTVGLEVRCSSAELQARSKSVAPHSKTDSAGGTCAPGAPAGTGQTPGDPALIGAMIDKGKSTYAERCSHC